MRVIETEIINALHQRQNFETSPIVNNYYGNNPDGRKQKRADGLIFLKLVARNGLGMDREECIPADARECDIYAFMVECNSYY
jgi:hypothetical protein